MDPTACVLLRQQRYLIALRIAGPLLFALAMSSTALDCQTARQAQQGIAWDVLGVWHSRGAAGVIRAGDAVMPGTLLQAEPSASEHTITILLPDGQSILSECYTEKDCARGFRVPELQTSPSPFAVELVQRIRGALIAQRTQPQLIAAAPPHAGRAEAVAVLGPGNRVEVAGLAAHLSDGQYAYDLTPIRSSYPPQSGVPLHKSGRSITIEVPGPGLYSATIFDSLKNARINYLIAAVGPQDKKIGGAFQQARELFKEWREDFEAWPAHDFQRAYLEALMFDLDAQTTAAPDSLEKDRVGADVTAEPEFSPKPGVSKGDMGVRLSCATSGAVIHYTVDGSQPLESSPVYRAPIVMKRIPLRIRAFAESPDKKDSAAVTGIFRVEQ